jgi:hypothetical protein
MLLPGWKTSRKIVVIESDDWGSIRMTDRNTFETLAINNPGIKNDPFSRFDAIESNFDLETLFEVLSTVKDKHGNPAIITANTIVANPSFEQIEKSDFNTYYYEIFTETLKRYPARERVLSLINEGIKENLYKPQFHGREHLNVSQWLEALRNGHKELLNAFKLGVFGINVLEKVSKRNNLMAAFDFENEKDRLNKIKIVNEGTQLFEKLFGFKSKTFIATTYVWDSSLEIELFKNGITGIQGIPFQYIPNPGATWYKRKFHFTGQKNKSGQIYLVRNASFEPALKPEVDVVGECLHRIELAFKWYKPAIICSHRVNFIGSLDENNRTRNLKLFKQLLSEIVKRWPDVEFMSSDVLVELINKNKNGKNSYFNT